MTQTIDWTRATVLTRIGRYTLLEHPIRGDTAPIYMTTPKGKLINTGFYDLGDFDLLLCEELEESNENKFITQGRPH
jgi:hypothetical protein